MTKPTDIGPNRTGIAVSPVHSKEAIRSAADGVPEASTDTAALEEACLEYASRAPPLGTMPPPASVKGAAKTVFQALKGQQASVFLDMIGERLAFERAGTRLYDALLARYDAASLHEGQPTREELEVIRDQELAHFQMLVGAMKQLGADPTAVTPSADVMGVASMGLGQVMSDPRTTFTEGLKTILVAELADNDGWGALAAMAERLGQDDLADAFKEALAQEEAHLAKVREWLANALLGQAGVAPTARREEQEPAPAP